MTSLAISICQTATINAEIVFADLIIAAIVASQAFHWGTLVVDTECFARAIGLLAATRLADTLLANLTGLTIAVSQTAATHALVIQAFVAGWALAVFQA